MTNDRIRKIDRITVITNRINTLASSIVSDAHDINRLIESNEKQMNKVMDLRSNLKDVNIDYRDINEFAPTEWLDNYGKGDNFTMILEFWQEKKLYDNLHQEIKKTEQNIRENKREYKELVSELNSVVW